MTPDSFEEARCLSRIQVKLVKRFLLPENLHSKTQQPRNLAKQPLTPQSPVPAGRFWHHGVSVARGTKVRGLGTCPRTNSNGTEGATQIRLQVSPALRSCVCATHFPAADPAYLPTRGLQDSKAFFGRIMIFSVSAVKYLRTKKENPTAKANSS